MPFPCGFGSCGIRARTRVSVVVLARGLSAAAFFSVAVAAAQIGVSSTQTSEQGSSLQSIRGIVVNANTNQPIGRALVQLQGHGMLTGSDGRFEFSGLSGTSASVQVRKQGFYDGLDPYMTATRTLTVGSRDGVQIQLYPEALITGTLTTAEGDPLPNLFVEALRRMEDESGSRWVPGGQTSTNIDGEFRLPLPGGDYVVETRYVQERPGSRGAILPVVAPSTGSSGGPEGGQGNRVSTIRLASGTEEHLELHPAVRKSHAVHIRIDSAGVSTEGTSPDRTAGRSPERRGPPEIQAHLANGLVFSPAVRDTDPSGDVLVDLPNGSYVLSASTGNQTEGPSYGETHVTVADEEVTGVSVHMQRALELTVEASLDPASDAAEVPSGPEPGGQPATGDPSTALVRQLGMFLQRTDEGLSMRTDLVSPVARRGGAFSFLLLPGKYRLRTTSYSQLFVQSANLGGTDLLAQDLVVDGSSSSQPLRLVVSSKTATVKGSAKNGDQPSAAYIYLIATGPSAAPIVRARSGGDGSFARTFLAPGSYSVVASESRIDVDLTNPAVQKQLGSFTKSVTVAAGETGNVDLEVMPASELKP